jgi:hypothetical protein
MSNTNNSNRIKPLFKKLDNLLLFIVIIIIIIIIIN